MPSSIVKTVDPVNPVKYEKPVTASSPIGEAAQGVASLVQGGLQWRDNQIVDTLEKDVANANSASVFGDSRDSSIDGLYNAVLAGDNAGAQNFVSELTRIRTGEQQGAYGPQNATTRTNLLVKTYSQRFPYLAAKFREIGTAYTSPHVGTGSGSDGSGGSGSSKDPYTKGRDAFVEKWAASALPPDVFMAKEMQDRRNEMLKQGIEEKSMLGTLSQNDFSEVTQAATHTAFTQMIGHMQDSMKSQSFNKDEYTAAIAQLKAQGLMELDKQFLQLQKDNKIILSKEWRDEQKAQYSSAMDSLTTIASQSDTLENKVRLVENLEKLRTSRDMTGIHEIMGELTPMMSVPGFFQDVVKKMNDYAKLSKNNNSKILEESLKTDPIGRLIWKQMKDGSLVKDVNDELIKAALDGQGLLPTGIFQLDQARAAAAAGAIASSGATGAPRENMLASLFNLDPSASAATKDEVANSPKLQRAKEEAWQRSIDQAARDAVSNGQEEAITFDPTNLNSPFQVHDQAPPTSSFSRAAYDNPANFRPLDPHQRNARDTLRQKLLNAYRSKLEYAGPQEAIAYAAELFKKVVPMGTTKGMDLGTGHVNNARPSAPVKAARVDEKTSAALATVQLTPDEEQVLANLPDSTGLKAQLAETVLRIENRGHESLATRADTKSKAGAVGPFQFMESTAKSFGLDPADRGDFTKSAEAFSKYFDEIFTRYNGNIAAMLADYNGGPSAGKAVLEGRKPPRKETQDYVDMGLHILQAAPELLASSLSKADFSQLSPGVYLNSKKGKHYRILPDHRIVAAPELD